jgi:tRNA (cytidine/uridine-2'-O-)-methyltransferase
VAPLFNVVLVRPQIPNNTGNIGRTCVATGSSLHLVHPLAFDTSEKACRRAGLDYWPRLAVYEHASWDEFLSRVRPQPQWLFSTKGSRPIFDAALSPGDWLIFGNETEGLPDAVLRAHPDRVLTLPMLPAERSLNLATAVCAVVYEGVRQALGRGDIRVDPSGRLIL